MKMVKKRKRGAPGIGGKSKSKFSASFAASFANLSAIPLPFIEAWPGTQEMITDVMNSEIKTTRCQPDHHMFNLPIGKQCRNKKKLISENLKQIKEELGPGNPNWFKDVTIKKLQEKKKTVNNILSSPLSLVNGSYLQSPCSSSTKFTPENTGITTPNFHDLLQSQKLTPSPLNRWIPPSLGDSPFMDDPLKISQKSQASSTPMIKSLGIDPDQSQMVWTSSLATPTLNSPMEIGSQSLEESQEKQKGLPRALFSPGPSSTDNDSFMCLDNTIEPDDPGKNCPKSPLVLENKFKPNDETIKLKTAVGKHEIKSDGVYNEFSMPLFSQDSPVKNTPEASVKQEVKAKQEIEKDCGIKQENQDTVTETLSDFFDPPSGSVGRRRCAPSRGKKRKSLENDAFDELVIKCEKESPVFSSQVKTKRFNSRKKEVDENFDSFNKSGPVLEEEASTPCLKENKKDNDSESSIDSCQKVIKSILSSNKKIKSQKKVRFSESLENYSDDLQAVRPKQDVSNYKSENSAKDVNSNEMEPTISLENKTVDKEKSFISGTVDNGKPVNEKYVKQCSSVSSRNEISVTSCLPQSNLKTNNENLCQISPIKNLSHTMFRGERKSSSDSDQADDLFSQVSPSALQEMCKAVTKVSDLERQDIALPGDRSEVDVTDPESNLLLESTSHQMKCEIDGKNNRQSVNSKLEENIVEVSKTQKGGQLKLGKKRKFLYPTTSQIAKSKPKTVYGIGTGYEFEQIKKEKNGICSGNGSSTSKITHDVKELGQKPTCLAGTKEVQVKVNNSTVKLESEQKPQMKSYVKVPVGFDQVVSLTTGQEAKTECRTEEILRESIKSIQTIESNIKMKIEQRNEDVSDNRNESAQTVELDNMNKVCDGFVSGNKTPTSISKEDKTDSLFQEQNSDSKIGEIRSEHYNAILKVKNMNQGCVGFASAKGSPLVVSVDSLKKAGALFQEVNEDYQTDGKVRNEISNEIVKAKNINHGSAGFVSAKGSKVVISEDAMKKASTLFQEENDVLKAEKTNKIENSKSDHCEIIENNDFVSDRFIDIEDLNKDFTSQRGSINSIKKPCSLVEQSQGKMMRGKMEFNQEHSGFSFASGQHVSISSKSLKIAEKLFSESNDESFVGKIEETSIKNSGDNSVFMDNENEKCTKKEGLDDTKVTNTCDKFENSEFKSENQMTKTKFQKAHNNGMTLVIKNSGDATTSEGTVLDDDKQYKKPELGYLNQEGMDTGDIFMDGDEDDFIFSQDDQDLRLMDIDNLTDNETKLDENIEMDIKHETRSNEREVKDRTLLIERDVKHGTNFSEIEAKYEGNFSETEVKCGTHLSERTPDRNEYLSDVGDITTCGFKTASGKSLIMSDDKLQKAKLTFENLDDHMENGNMAGRSCESSDSAKTAKVEHLQIQKRSTDLDSKSVLKRKTNQKSIGNTKNNSEVSQSRNKNFVFQTAGQTTTDQFTTIMSTNDKGRLLVSEFQKELTKSVDEDLEQSGNMSDKTCVTKQSGHLQHGFRQKNPHEGDFSKATSVMSEIHNEFYKSDSISPEDKNDSAPGFSTAGGKTLGLPDSTCTKKLDNDEFSTKLGKPINFSKGNGKDLKIASGVGFSTAGGKNIELNNVTKHPLISEFKELYNNSSFTDKEMENQKEIDVPLKGFTMASGKSLNLKDSNVSKVHSLISEFQNELSSDSDPLELIIASKKSLNKRLAHESGKMLHEKSLDEKKTCTTIKEVQEPKLDSAASAKRVPKTCDEISDIDNFDNLLKQFSAKKNQGFKIPQKSEKQTMKSSTISARFPPGSSVPKGFRPFKAPKLISKPNSSVTSNTSQKPKIEPKIQSSKVNVGNKCFNTSTKDSVSKQCLEGHSDGSLNLNNNVGSKHLNDKDFDMDLDGSMINQMFADDLEASQKFSPNSGKPVKIDDTSINAKEYEFGPDEHDGQGCVKPVEKFYEEANLVTHQTETSEVETKSQDSGEVIIGTERQPLLSHKMSNVNGFQTASGKTLVISENSLNKALTFMNDTDRDFNMCRNEVEENGEDGKVEGTGESFKDGTKEKCHSREPPYNISEKSENFEKTVDSCSVLQRIMEPFEEKEDDYVTKLYIPIHDCSMGKFPSFQTASGKNVKVSESALSKVRTLFNENTDEDCKVSPAEVDVSLASADGSLKNTKLGEKSVLNKKEYNTFYDQNKNVLGTKVLNEKNQNHPCLVTDQHEHRVDITHELEKEKSSSLLKMNLFQTASGKSVSVSKEALEKVKSDHNKFFEDFSDNEDLEIKGDNTCYSGVLVNDQSTSTMQQFQEDQSCSSPNRFTRSRSNTSNPFMTASGKSVSISQKAIDKAKSFLDGTDCNDFTTDVGHGLSENSASDEKSVKNIIIGDGGNPFQTASGKKIGVSAQALHKARQQLNDSEHENGGYKHVEDVDKVSEGEINLMETEHAAIFKPKSISERTASNCYDDRVNVSGEPKSQITSICPFMSASGKSVGISESSLKQARQILGDDIQNDYSTIDKENITSECYLEQDNGRIQTTHASMLQRKMSEQRVRSSTCSLMESEDDFDNIKSSLQDEDKKESTYLDDTIGRESRDKISPFQSASGKNIVISRNALEQARKTLENSETGGFSKKKISGNDVNKVNSKISVEKSVTKSPFQSASGKNIVITNNALEQARKTLDNETASGFTGEIISGNDLKQGNSNISMGISDLNVTKSPFQSAAGKSVSVSITALNKARESLVSGNTIQNYDTSLKGLENHKSTSSTHHSGNLSSEDDFLVPDTLFDEMEPPRKKFKTDIEEDQSKDTTRPIRDRKTMAPCTAIPEGYSMDRRSAELKLKPLQCHSLHNQRSRTPVISYENSDDKTNSNVTKTVFKTPYKINKTDVHDSAELTHGTSTKSPMPVFVPKLNKVPNTCINTGRKVFEISNSKQTENQDLMSWSEEHMEIDMCEQTGIARNTKNKMERIQEGRHKQREIIDNKKLCKVRQVTGRLLQMKMESVNRLSLKEVIDVYSTSSSRTQLLASGVSRPVKNVRASNAFQCTFQLGDYYGHDITHVYVGDGAYLVPKDDGTAGKEEFFNAFLTIDGVDPALINEKWFENHYSLIVWKLAAYEVASPCHFAGRSLTPEMLLLQMKYRYDREVDRCHRSALKKILERDDSAGKRMVLCVCDVKYRHDNTTDKQTSNCNNLSSQVSLEVTDGWYRVHAQLDTPLTHLVHKGHIKIGYKLCVSGAELMGSEDACTPLEAPSTVMLKFHMNSTRPETWDTKLGYQADPCPLCVPLTGLHGDGGLIGCLDVVLARTYPLMYMEKVSEGVCIFRSEQAEEKAKQIYQNIQQDKMENLYRKLESRFESEEAEDKCISKKRWTRKEVEYLQSGQEIYEAMSATRQSDILESYLSHHQMSLLMDYRRQLQDEKRQRLQAEFQKAWNDGEQNSTTRNVIPLIKFRVVGCAKKDLDNKASTIITVWRPTSEIMELEEGKRYKIFSLNASTARSKYIQNEVQLTATRQTRFKQLPIDENLLDILYEPREVSSVTDIKKRPSVLGEVDFVGLVISVVKSEFVESGKEQDIVYAADINGDILGIKFWTGVKAAGLEDVLGEGKVFCCCNLMDKSIYRSTILPVVEYSGEFSQITQTARNSSQRKVVDTLKKIVLKNASKTEFIREGKDKLDELLQRKRNSYLKRTPERQQTTARSIDSDDSSDTFSYQQTSALTETFNTKQSISTSSNNQEKGKDCTVTLKLVSPTRGDEELSSTEENVKTPNRSLNQIKMSKLLSYGSPVPLSPLPVSLNYRKTNKAFKPPVLTNKPP